MLLRSEKEIYMQLCARQKLEQSETFKTKL